MTYKAKSINIQSPILNAKVALQCEKDEDAGHHMFVYLLFQSVFDKIYLHLFFFSFVIFFSVLYTLACMRQFLVNIEANLTGLSV